ncbi:MAG: RNA polymerase sigma factor [Clostridia bacterium]|nr:RNA polymerase sigma factor [Clostridia bacterium]
MKSAKLQRQVETQILASYPSLFRLAFTYMKNADDAMDVVQESVYKAMMHCDAVRNEAAIRSWLCRIVINTATDQLRRRAREVAIEEVPEEGREDVYSDVDLHKLLGRLDERERTVVVLRFFEDMRLQDIAEITGENLNTVKTILYRSLKKLKIQAEEGEPSK